VVLVGLLDEEGDAAVLARDDTNGLSSVVSMIVASLIPSLAGIPS
jgi:hypothetical protein